MLPHNINISRVMSTYYIYQTAVSQHAFDDSRLLHYSIQFSRYHTAMKSQRNKRLLFTPFYFMHILQLLDVVYFSVLKQAYES